MSEHDELTEQATGIIAAYLWLDANPPMTVVPQITEAAKQTIALVRTDERKKVMEELLSDNALLYMVAGYHGVRPDKDSIREHLHAIYEDEEGYVTVGYPDEKANMQHAIKSTFNHLACDKHKAALTAIGLTEEQPS